ncbi:hypothetical protein KEM48_010444 [Puccinia striiformis f. sp. tritici PST-130]|nr:hypothetical protein KEM48_010444 [Puccinia striiformis f. sp. tritici PST-130]
MITREYLDEIIPTYLAPALSAVSIWCLALPQVPAITNLFGGSLPAEGMDGGHLPFISYNLFDKHGHRYNLTAAVMKNGTGNAKRRDINGRQEADQTAWQDFETLPTSRNNEEYAGHSDLRCSILNHAIVANAGILVGATALAFLSSHLADSGLAPEALATSLLISFVLCIASGYFYGTLGIPLFVQPVTQMLGGILFPGNAIGTMWFTMYGSTSVQHVYSCLRTSNLGTDSSVDRNYRRWYRYVAVMLSIVTSQREVLLMPNGNGMFTGMVLSVMASQFYWHTSESKCLVVYRQLIAWDVWCQLWALHSSYCGLCFSVLYAQISFQVVSSTALDGGTQMTVVALAFYSRWCGLPNQSSNLLPEPQRNSRLLQIIHREYFSLTPKHL